jgi:hypothetical protein
MELSQPGLLLNAAAVADTWRCGCGSGGCQRAWRRLQQRQQGMHALLLVLRLLRLLVIWTR